MDGLEQPTIEAKIQKSPKSRKGVAPLIRRLHLDYPELTDSQIARKVGCSPANVGIVLRRFLGKHTTAELSSFQENKADIYDALQLKVLSSVTESKLRKTPAISLITGAAILEDKARLVRGQATGINVTALVDVAELLRNQQ